MCVALKHHANLWFHSESEQLNQVLLIIVIVCPNRFVSQIVRYSFHFVTQFQCLWTEWNEISNKIIRAMIMKWHLNVPFVNCWSSNLSLLVWGSGHTIVSSSCASDKSSLLVVIRYGHMENIRKKIVLRLQRKSNVQWKNRLKYYLRLLLNAKPWFGGFSPVKMLKMCSEYFYTIQSNEYYSI